MKHSYTFTVNGRQVTIYEASSKEAALAILKTRYPSATIEYLWSEIDPKYEE